MVGIGRPFYNTSEGNALPRGRTKGQGKMETKTIQRTLLTVGAAALVAGSAGPGAAAEPVSTPVGGKTRKLFLDVHDIGKGKVKAKDVAGLHRRDLATQGKHGVEFKAYWVDEKEGKVYCLAEAPSAEAANQVHKEAHGVLANKIMEVDADNMNWAPRAGMKLYMDVHHLPAGKVTAADVAEAHKKDVAAQGPHNVRFLNYWFDAASGTVMCLAEAPSAEAAVAVHREAHGLLPASIEEVTEGR
jgi:hypothetical protein